MSRHPHVPGLFAFLDRARSERLARRALSRELAGYATPADRDSLALLLDERAELSGTRDDEVVSILRGQAGAELFRAS